MNSEQELKEQLDRLSLSERAKWAVYLIESLDSETDADAERLWEEEINRRVESIRNGTAVGEPAQVVMDRLRQKYS